MAKKSIWLAQFSLYGERNKNISVAVYGGGKKRVHAQEKN